MKANLTLFKLTMQRPRQPMVACFHYNNLLLARYPLYFAFGGGMRNFSNNNSNVASEGDKIKFEEIKKRQ